MQANNKDASFERVTPLMKAAASGFIGHIKLILNKGVNIDSMSSTGNTALMYACTGGYIEIVNELLKNGANIHITNVDGHSAFMEAASAGHVMVAKILLNHGAKIDTYSNKFKKSALTLACYGGHLEMVKFLLEAGAGSGQDNQTNELFTALMEASEGGHIDVARVLLDSGAQVKMKTESLDSPLSLASFGGHVDLALLYIQHGANIEEVNDDGYTPLMEAVEEGHFDMVSTLLIKGANVNAVNIETHETALTLACSNGNLNIVYLLIQNGADLELGSPLLDATREGHINIVKYFLQNYANKYAQTIDTGMIYACENGYKDIAELYLQFGANLNYESENGRTPLMIACRAGHLSTVKFLISKNANINKATPNKEHTPLSLACNGGHIDIVNLLLEYSADPFYILLDNSNMVIEAAKGGHTNIIKLLLDQVISVDESEFSEVMPNTHNIVSKIIKNHGPTAKRNASCTQDTKFHKVQLNIPTNSLKNNKSKIKTTEEYIVNDGDSMPNVLTAAANQHVTKDLLKKSHHLTKESSDINYPFQKVHCSREKFINTTKISSQYNSGIIKRCLSDNNKESLMKKNPFCEGLIKSNKNDMNLKKSKSNFSSIEEDVKDNNVPDVVVKKILPMSRVSLHGIPKNSIIDSKSFEDKLNLSNSDDKIPIDVQSRNMSNFAAVSQHSLGYSSNTGESNIVSNVGILHGINVNSQTVSNHNTALTIACSGGHEEAVKFLLLRGANIDHKTKKGITSLTIAVLRGYDNIVKILLNHKANIETQCMITKDTPLTLACSYGFYEICKLLLEKGANVEHRNINDNTPMNLAAAFGFQDIVVLLYSFGAEINPQTNSKFGISPLMLAIKTNHKKVVEILLKMKCDIDAQIKYNGDTALTILYKQSRDAIFPLLLDNQANVNNCNKNKLSYVMKVANLGNVELGEMLINKRADINNYCEGDTALIIAANLGHVQFVELLLAKNAQVDIKNKKGQSPLWIAANSGYLDIVKLLYHFKANLDSQDNKGTTCIMAALQKGHVNVVRWMVNYVTQFPSNNEMIQHFITLQNKEVTDNCFDCMVIIWRERPENNKK